MKKVIVASKNPVKIEACVQGFQQVFPQDAFDFQGINVSSDVSAQPMTTRETYQGAYNRALAAKQVTPTAHFWVGIEGGVDFLKENLEVFAWIVVFSSDNQGVAKTSSFILPPKVSELVKNGLELGVADDMVFRQNNSKTKGGSVGILTNGLINRTMYYTQAVMLALIPFINKSLYQEIEYSQDLVD